MIKDKKREAVKIERGNPTWRRVRAVPLPEEAKVSSDIHVGIIVPPSPFVVPNGWEWVHTAPFEGPSVISALLKGLGYRVSLIDKRDDFNADSLREDLEGVGVVAISCFEDNFPYIKKAAEISKEVLPGAPVILGGPLAASVPRVMMEHTLADYLVAGEGELTLTELMDFISGNEHALPLEGIEGILWKDAEGKVRSNPPRPQLIDLDAVPVQDLGAWQRFEDGFVPEIYLSASRGCPYNCTFCYRPFPELRFKSPEKVKEEISYYSRFGFKMAWVSDLTFVTDKEYAARLLDTAFSVHDFRWSCFNRVDTADPELYRKMAEKGCDIILYGFEAVSREVLEGYRKGTSRNDILRAIDVTRGAGIKCGGLFIVGAPNETSATLKETVDFCAELKEITRVKYFSAIPGTFDYYRALEKGLIKSEPGHLMWLAAERSVEEDILHPEFVKVAENVTKEQMRAAYHKINHMIERRPYDYNTPYNPILPESEARSFRERPKARD
ncbi:MAG: radical SAM protein [Candidatus Omnitrophica bacterium]|nr:radical SAM protein [Candidatus Omnitrophota bacterium]